MSDEGFKRFHSFKLRSGMLLRRATIELDGKKLKGIRSFSVGALAGDLVEVTVTFLSDDIDVEVTGGVAMVEKRGPV